MADLPLFDSKKLNHYPTQPGVYLLKGIEGAVLYVGKAKNIKQRLKQYFLPGGDGRFMLPILLSKVVSIDTIVLSSEKEALLLENNLIKKHRPKFNVLLKDDKSYIALKVTHKQQWPMLQLVRYKGKPASDVLYFGPYTSATAARTTFDLLNKFFPLRQCSDREFANRTRPCILYDMKRCIAPCVGRCTAEEYDRNVQKTIKFLRGQDKELLRELYEEMREAADTLDFEKAQQLLGIIRQIESSVEVQRVDKPQGIDSDAISIFRRGEEVIAAILIFRAGKLLSARHYCFSNVAQDNEEIVQSLLLQHYERSGEIPAEIYLPFPLDNSDHLADILSNVKRSKVAIISPMRGEKKKYVDMAHLNAEAHFKREKDINALRQRTLLDIEEKFHLHNYPRRIECIDNSNLFGSEPVAAIAAFTDGVKDRGRYRKYHIKGVQGPDDYSAMREVVLRRCKRGKQEGDLPDLLLIDGGKGHLNVVMKALRELEIVTIDLIAIAKEKGKHDKGIRSEQLFLPTSKEPISLRPTSPILFLFQQIRDEAHRFAISFHRRKRSKKVISSTLEAIKTIGAVKRKLLFAHFGSIEAIKSASREDLLKVKGISRANVDAIIAYFSIEQ